RSSLAHLPFQIVALLRGMAHGEGLPGQHAPLHHPGDQGGFVHPRQDQSQEEENQSAETYTTAKAVDTETWTTLGACAVLLLAAIAVARFYKK
ncbi:MAG: hypothetical protein Q4C02_05405, partial [Eubacteriales bacterium]|nr:hypothetical protein [Eubacteriales bacterium]